MFRSFKWSLFSFAVECRWAMQVHFRVCCYLSDRVPTGNRKIELLNYQKLSFCTAKHHCHSTVYCNYIQFFSLLVSLTEQGAPLEALPSNTLRRKLACCRILMPMHFCQLNCIRNLVNANWALKMISFHFHHAHQLCHFFVCGNSVLQTIKIGQKGESIKCCV